MNTDDTDQIRMKQGIKGNEGKTGGGFEHEGTEGTEKGSDFGTR